MFSELALHYANAPMSIGAPTHRSKWHTQKDRLAAVSPNFNQIF
jgi:hypothetical protein